jgi:hypothetical protein
MLKFSWGKSMLPSLTNPSIVKIEEQPVYTVGDIIMLKTHDGIFHVHRISKINDKKSQFHIRVRMRKQ